MAKTRSRSLNLVVKKEEHEDKTKLVQLLRGTNNASKTKSKVTKNRKPIQAQLTKVKSENDDDNKALLASPKKKASTRSKITAEKITKLIGYIVNNKMSMHAAARKVGISYNTAQSYYHEYQDDPEHKIPLPKSLLNKPPSIITQEKIDNLIRYIVSNKMNITQAAKKADVSRHIAAKYYTKYLEDPERKIPLLDERTGNWSKRCTQKQVADVIGYIVRDKMSMVQASKKANMSINAARIYYVKYLNNPNRDIPNPHEPYQFSAKRCTNDQVKSLIEYVDGGMTLTEASVKVNMSSGSASKYYKQYLNDPENTIPTPETNKIRKPSKLPSLDQVKNFFCYVIINKLSSRQASIKAGIPQRTAYSYYRKYVENSIQKTNIKDLSYSIEKMKRLIKLVEKEKMSLLKAAEKVQLNISSAYRYYQRYLKNPQYAFPENNNKQCTQEDIRKLIDCIERGKMNLQSAARSAQIGLTSARKYYKQYQNDPEHRIPVPMIRGRRIKIREFDKCTQIVADIYKDNPSIKPIHGNHDAFDIKVKEELEEEDTKIALKMENN